ncbi:helix-turn-helix domain-containing protein [Streptosporangium sp. NPDC051023]|uniref:helix-turn-helix domain-containing protein n=1 Tax=Streptosporangium sp. NPDC051023 TaxID=3155410 RepID=UPI00344CCF1D
MSDRRPPAEREESRLRRAEVMRLRRVGHTFEQIGEQLGITRQAAHKLYKACLAEIPAEEIATYRAEQAARLDALLVEANEVLARKHVTVSNGKVITIDGEPLEDDGVILDAIKTILDIEARRAKLFGLDAPTKTAVTVSDSITAEIENLAAQLGLNVGAAEPAEP